MPCSQVHFIPILDELRRHDDQNANNDRRSSAENLRSSALKKRRGGPRPNSGPPRGNLNALKHGRFSRRHKIILEAILDVPQAREALVAIMKRNRKRQKQAELEAAYILMRWLATHNPQFLPAALDQAAANFEGDPAPRNDQTQNDQLEQALTDLREAFNNKLLRKTTKKRTPKPADQPNAGRAASLTRPDRSANLNPIPEQEIS